MVLNTPWVLELCIWLFKPLDRLITILTGTNKRDNTLRIEPASIVDSLQENVVQSIDDLAMLRRSSRNLVDRLKRHLLTFARELHTNLVPELSQSLLYCGHIGAFLCEVGPGPTVMVNVDDGVEASVRDHVDDIGNALEPFGIDSPVWRLRGEVVRPGNRETNTLKSSILDIIKCGSDDWGIIPASFL